MVRDPLNLGSEDRLSYIQSADVSKSPIPEKIMENFLLSNVCKKNWGNLNFDRGSGTIAFYFKMS